MVDPFTFAMGVTLAYFYATEEISVLKDSLYYSVISALYVSLILIEFVFNFVVISILLIMNRHARWCGFSIVNE